MDDTADSQLEITKSEKAALKKLRQMQESPQVVDGSTGSGTPTATPSPSSVTPSPKSSSKSTIFARGSNVQGKGPDVVTKASAPAPSKPACKKAAAKPKSVPKSTPPEKTDSTQPKQEIKRSNSTGVGEVLKRGNTTDSDVQPKNLEEMKTAAEALEEEMKEQEKSLAKLEKEGKRRERDPIAHARRMRFYRSLSSRGL